MRTLPPVLAAALAACAGSGLTVRPTGVTAPPRPAGCAVEYLLKAPDRPYEALADLETHVTMVPREGALEVLRPKACELGAEAVIVIRNQVLNELGHVLVAGTAIRYRPAPPAQPAPPPAAAPPAGAPAPDDQPH